MPIRPRHLAAPLAAAVILAPVFVGSVSDASGEKVINTAYTTGYTYFDNTPASSAEIAFPGFHDEAAGTGTYDDPITVAVGIDDEGTLDYPVGTKMYVPSVRRYFIVEDQCGLDGDSPCHNLSKAGDGATTWIDLWIGGASGTKSEANACANAITDVHRIVVNPKSTYAVASGEGVFHDGFCDGGYSDTLVTTSTNAEPLASTSSTAPDAGAVEEAAATTSTSTTDAETKARAYGRHRHHHHQH